MKHKHTSVYSIDFYACSSGVSNWNATFKVLLAFTTLLLCIVLNDIYVSLFIILTMGIFTVYKGKIKFLDYMSLLAIPLMFMILASLAIAIGISEKPLGQYNLNLHICYIYSSNANILNAISILLKALGAVSAMYMMTLSTTASDIIVVLKKIHIPSIIIELMDIIYRFIFILVDTNRCMKNSAESRLGYVDFKTSCYSFGNTASNLLLISLRKADNYYNAMESRCYDGEICFLEEHKKVKNGQAFSAILYILSIIFIWHITK